MSESCLGLYINKNYIKYAKLIRSSGDSIEIESQGLVFVNNNLNQQINDIIQKFADENSIIITNVLGIKYEKNRVFKEIRVNDVKNVINLEYESWCEKFSFPPDSGIYVYSLTELPIGDYKYATLGIVEKNELESKKELINKEDLQIYPTELVMKNVVPTENNYILINYDEKLFLTVVKNSSVVYEVSYDNSMNEIFERFSDVLGDFTKAYETSKAINVFNELSYDTGYKDLESILEPMLREILQTVSEDIKRYKEDINKLFITGSCTLFTNIDTLMTEFFGMKCEILVPNVIYREEKINNISEVIEATPAIALARMGFEKERNQLNFLNQLDGNKNQLSEIVNNFKDRINEFFKSKKVKPKKESVKTKKDNKILEMLKNFNNPIVKNVLTYGVYVIIVLTTAIVGYSAYSKVYIDSVSSEITKYDDTKADIRSEITKVESDINSINEEIQKYKNVNDKIDEQKRSIESGELTYAQTYKVASFMQEIIRIIPKEVELVSISSDDNKKVTMIANSAGYKYLGFFITSIKTEKDLLNNINIVSIKNADRIEVTIEGDLP